MKNWKNGSVVIYLSGSIKKGKEDKRDLEAFWTTDLEEEVVSGVDAVSVSIVNPLRLHVDRSAGIVHLGCDLYHIGISDFLLVDLRERRGIGIGAEMMYASGIGIPVISWCPTGSQYRRSLHDFAGQRIEKWVHPFVYGLSYNVCSTLAECIASINMILHHGTDSACQKTVASAIEVYQRWRETQGDRV